MAKLGNAVQLNVKDNKNPYATIYTYLTRKGQDSINTKKTYERHIRDFFRTMGKGEIKQLVEDDLIFTPQEIEAYQVALKEKYKGATVNNTMTALKECYNKLEKGGFAVSASWFDVERYDEHDSDSYDTLSHEEIVAILALVSKTRKGIEKALLIRLAYATAFRKESIRTMTWNQIVNIDDIWYAKVLGKGNKWSHKKLSDDLYEALMAHKEKAKGENVFELTTKTIQKMMNYINDNMDFGDRNIVFHSFKKASIEEVNIISGGDIKAMQNHGDHSNASTTINKYLANKKLEDLVTVDVNTHIPTEAFDELSQEEFVNLVKSMDRTTQIRLLRKMGAM